MTNKIPRSTSALLSAPGLFLFLICTAHLIVTFIWLTLDSFPLVWDAGDYYTRSLMFFDIQKNAGWISALHGLLSTENYHPPGLWIATAPLYSIFWASENVAVFGVSGLFFCVLICSTYFCAKKMSGVRVGCVAAALISLFPTAFGMSRTFLLDLPACACVTATIAVLLRTRGFESRWGCFAAGCVFGIGLWLKESSVFFIAGPALVIFVSALLHSSRRGQIFLGAGLFVGTACLIAAPAYLPNFSERVQGFTLNALQGGVENDPTGLTRESLLFYYVALERMLGPVFFYAFCVAAVASILTRNVLPLVWIALPYLIFSGIDNKCARYMFGALPAVALIIAQSIDILRSKSKLLANATTAILLSFGVLQFAFSSFREGPIDGGHLFFSPGQLSVEAPYTTRHLSNLFYVQEIADGARRPIPELWNMQALVDALELEQARNLTYGLNVFNLSDYPLLSAPLISAAYQRGMRLNLTSAAWTSPEQIRTAHVIIRKIGGYEIDSWRMDKAVRAHAEFEKLAPQFKVSSTFSFPDGSNIEFLTRRALPAPGLNSDQEVAGDSNT
ncbi:MAG: glycosyltransferase family 39 protein [Deltaproteobacteria bacterium]|nr:glycosyltransferase family 39 protein [Deltaproteobacteria bacterium]